MRFRPAAQDDEDAEDADEGIDDADLGAARAEVENRMHARMLQERQAGNNLTDEQLEEYVKERCAIRPAHAAAGRRARPAARFPCSQRAWRRLGVAFLRQP